MRPITLFTATTLTALTTAFLIPPGLFSPLSLPEPLQSLFSPYQTRQQLPMNPGPVQPSNPSAPSDSENSPPNNSDLTISDILPKTRSINIFASLTRDISTISGRLESTTPNSNTTLLAPLNSVMQALPRKPWEDPPNAKPDHAGAARNEDKAADNLRRFVEMHAVPRSPWGEGEKVASLGGKEMWWERKGDKRVVMPGQIEVDSVLGKTGNGEVWCLKGVVNYE